MGGACRGIETRTHGNEGPLSCLVSWAAPFLLAFRTATAGAAGSFQEEGQGRTGKRGAKRE